MKFLGYKLVRDEDKEDKPTLEFVQKQPQDGQLEISSGAAGFSTYGAAFDNAPTTNEIELITRYRELSETPEVDKAIDDIINEAFSYNEEDDPVEINLTKLEKISEGVKKKITEEFENILKMLNFRHDGYKIFRHWYVDGRLFYYKKINQANPSEGITELRYIDPRKIKKIRHKLPANKNESIPVYASVVQSSIDVNNKYLEYYVYNPEGVNPKNPNGVPIAPDTITYVHSGVLDKSNSIILSHLHKAMKNYNSLKMLEDAVVIYRIVRAPERRMFNIEVGNLPRVKAEQYVAEIIKKFNKKLKFNPETGEVFENKRVMTMMEDFWFPKRDGKGTTVETLPSGQNLGEMEDVEYFKKKLYESLHVPISRLSPDTMFNMGRASEITRDELKFSKFVSRLRARFAHLFLDILGDQILLKGIMTQEEWDNEKENIIFDFLEDNFFAELKWNEIWSQRFATAQNLDPFVSIYVSRQWVKDTILHLTEDEQDKIAKEIEKEREEMEEKPGPSQQQMQPQDQPPPDGEDEQDPNALPEGEGEDNSLFQKPKKGGKTK